MPHWLKRSDIQVFQIFVQDFQGGHWVSELLTLSPLFEVNINMSFLTGWQLQWAITATAGSGFLL